MNRTLKIGLLWIALVTVVIAIWLAFQPQPPTSTIKAGAPAPQLR